MKREALLQRLGLAAVFVLLGICLLISGREVLAAEGVRTVDAELPGGRGTLYLPGAVSTVTLPAHEEGEETLTTAGTVSGALILSHWPDGARAAATELCRRGVAVLIVTDGTDAQTAWDWLLSRPEVRSDSAAILSGDRRAVEALAGEETLVKAATGSPAANLLVLTGQEASPEDLAAFYGAREDACRGFTGFFSEKTARAAAAVGGDEAAFYRRSVMTRTLDWLGSCLGHRVELADDDLLWGRVLGWRIAGGLCFLAALKTLAGCRKRKTDERTF